MKICKKCGKLFNDWEIINGKRICLNKRSYCLECSPYLSHNKIHLKIKELYCLHCGKQLSGNQEKYCSIKCKNKEYKGFRDATAKRRKKKESLVKYLGNKCKICGYNRCIEALEFHHREGKDFTISNFMDKNIEELKMEVNKCDLVCSNCHAEIHSKTLNTC